MKLGALKSSICDLRFAISKRQSAIGNWQLTLVVVLILCGLTLPAYCQIKDKEVVLLLEQTPVKGGEITPVAGVHHFKSAQRDERPRGVPQGERSQ